MAGSKRASFISACLPFPPSRSWPDQGLLITVCQPPPLGPGRYTTPLFASHVESDETGLQDDCGIVCLPLQPPDQASRQAAVPARASDFIPITLARFHALSGPSLLSRRFVPRHGWDGMPLSGRAPLSQQSVSKGQTERNNVSAACRMSHVTRGFVSSPSLNATNPIKNPTRCLA